ncbi:MAG: PH domain-containing protein [Thermoguttaceae bacterium]|jgi:membrane protein YdbS with pleckstrin-like domain|nr:PH domain-containing protein [Thermoguttaceae bacterium]
MQCRQCGEEVIQEAVFCHRCGARVEADSEAFSETNPIGQDYRHGTANNSGNENRSPAERFRDAAANRSRDAGEPEHTLWEGGYSSKAMLSRWLLSMVVTFALPIGGIWWPRGYVWLAIAAIILLLWAYQLLVLISRRWSVHYRLTNQRFIHELGVFRRVTDRIELIDVNDITFEQGMIDRLVRVGTIRISSNDRSHPELTLAGIEDVAHVAGLIDETYRAERRRRGLLVEDL